MAAKLPVNRRKITQKNSIFSINLLFNKIGIPPFLGAGVASIIGYASASLYVLYVLRKEHNLRYGKTFILLFNLILPILIMVGVVLLTMYLIPVNFDSKLSSIIYIAINAVVGAIVYGLLVYKNGILEDVLGDKFGIITKLDKIFKKNNK